jgi:biopolymer transport protein TolR
MGVDVELPQAEAKTVETDEQLPLIISIKADGSLFLNEGNQADSPVTAPELPQRIQAVLAKKPGLAVLIRGDQHVDYGRVVMIMAALKEAGVPSVGLMTRPADE